MGNADETGRGIPPHWSVYIAVDDVAATTSKVAGAGGTVILPAMDVMDVGRMAVVLDPTGGVLSLWEAKTHTGFGRMSEPGAVTWCELMTDDVDRAADFLSAILDVPHETMDMGPGAAPYILVGPAGEQGAGVMQKTPEMGPMPTNWGVYFEVADTDASVARAQQLGGAVLVPAQDIVPGRFAILQDPQGAVFGIIKSSPMMAG